MLRGSQFVVDKAFWPKRHSAILYGILQHCRKQNCDCSIAYRKTRTDWWPWRWPPQRHGSSLIDLRPNHGVHSYLISTRRAVNNQKTLEEATFPTLCISHQFERYSRESTPPWKKHRKESCFFYDYNQLRRNVTAVLWSRLKRLIFYEGWNNE